MDAAGIYVVVALAHDCPTCAVTRDEAPECYPPELKTQGQKVVNAFAKYDNTLAFSAGNEVNHFAPPDHPESNAPCQKKFLRDMRQYLASCNSLRNVPVGLISADSHREELAEYYNCRGNNEDEFESAEWYGLNTYVFCDGSATTYDDAPGLGLLEQSMRSLNYSIPVLLTEFGCLSKSFPEIDNYPGQRNFLQARWLLTQPTLREQFAGGFAFEYSIEKENAQSASPYPFHTFGLQNYGIGYFQPELCDDIDTACSYHPLPAFDNLKKAYEAVIGNHVANGTENFAFTVTEDEFAIPPSRSGRSGCPEGFPSLDSFSWKADRTRSTRCPRRGSESKHVCRSKAARAASSQMQSLALKALLGIFGGVIAIMLAYLVVLHRNKRRRSDIPEILTFPTNQRSPGGDSSSDADDSYSDESAGLLSMQKRYQDGRTGGGRAMYHAVGSDSSSE